MGLDAPAGPRHLERFRRLVMDTTGIKLPPSKQTMIEARLRRRLLALGLSDLSGYLDHVFDGNGLEAELPEIVEAMTTNKTDFFRESEHYRILSEKLIPEALSRSRSHAPVRFRLWSAAASIGAEAWSAAMLLAKAAAADPRLEWAILGTDISRNVLEVARRAVYPEEELAPVPDDLRAAYTMTRRAAAGSALARIVPELRARVRFVPLNLLSVPHAVDTGLDVVFLRNVLIYFEPDTQMKVTAGVATHLRQGGHLIVGHSESMTVRHPGLIPVAPGVFRREGEIR